VRAGDGRWPQGAGTRGGGCPGRARAVGRAGRNGARGRSSATRRAPLRTNRSDSGDDRAGCESSRQLTVRAGKSRVYAHGARRASEIFVVEDGHDGHGERGRNGDRQGSRPIAGPDGADCKGRRHGGQRACERAHCGRPCRRTLRAVDARSLTDVLRSRTPLTICSNLIWHRRPLRASES
jgi:hypothetical protein